MTPISETLTYKQLTKNDFLSNAKLTKIATLIYQTDAYISQAMFLSKEDALNVIPELFRRGDKMFHVDNIFVAETFDGDIKGLILWKKGPLHWTSALFHQVSRDLSIAETPWLSLVQQNYFEEYNQTDSGTIELIDVCVSEDVRGMGIGSAMISAFIRAHLSDPIMELFVLGDNYSAIRVYEKCGFTKNLLVNGFSIDNRDLPCIRMQRRISPP